MDYGWTKGRSLKIVHVCFTIGKFFAAHGAAAGGKKIRS